MLRRFRTSVLVTLVTLVAFAIFAKSANADPDPPPYTLCQLISAYDDAIYDADLAYDEMVAYYIAMSARWEDIDEALYYNDLELAQDIYSGQLSTNWVGISYSNDFNEFKERVDNFCEHLNAIYGYGNILDMMDYYNYTPEGFSEVADEYEDWVYAALSDIGYAEEGENPATGLYWDRNYFWNNSVFYGSLNYTSMTSNLNNMVTNLTNKRLQIDIWDND